MRDEMRIEYLRVIGDLGLSDKETAVYLASLELGPSPVQAIARRSGVARATTYVVLEALMDMGLATKVTEDSRTLFYAESPRHLLRSIEQEEAALKTRRSEISRILPELEAIMRQTGDKPTVRYFSGLEGLHTLRWDMVQRSQSRDTWLNIFPIDLLSVVYGDDEMVHKARIAKLVPQKTIFTTASEEKKNNLLKSAKKDKAERRYVEPNRFLSNSGMTIFGDRVAIGTFKGELGGVIIESKSVAHMMEELFNMAWDGLDKKK